MNDQQRTDKARDVKAFMDRVDMMQRIQTGFLNGMFRKYLSSVSIYNAGGPGSFLIRIKHNDEKADSSQWMKHYHQNLLDDMTRPFVEHLTHKPELKIDSESSRLMYAYVSFAEDLHGIDDPIKNASVVVLNEKYLSTSILHDDSSDRARIVDVMKKYLAGLRGLRSLV